MATTKLKTVHSVPGKYSEIMIYVNQSIGIARLVVDRFSQVLFSTSGTERSEVMKALEDGMSPVEAIDSYIERNG